MTRRTSNTLKTVALACAVVFGAPALAMAGCSGATVTDVAQYEGQCNNEVTFKVDKGGYWICTSNEAQARLVTAAYLAGKKVSFQMHDKPNDCQPGGHYYVNQSIKYIKLN